MVPRRLPSPALPCGVPWHRPSPLVVGREDAPTGGVVAILGLPGPGGAAALVLAVGGRGRHGGCPGGCAAEVPGSAAGCSGVSRGARPGCINQGGAAAGSPRVAQAQTGARGVGVDMGGVSFRPRPHGRGGAQGPMYQSGRSSRCPRVAQARKDACRVSGRGHGRDRRLATPYGHAPRAGGRPRDAGPGRTALTRVGVAPSLGALGVPDANARGHPRAGGGLRSRGASAFSAEAWGKGVQGTPRAPRSQVESWRIF